ncbi:MAG: ornithine cyclodeaminase family protein [Chloroflexota bacterium]|nr:ornithine cyclodeaminase family protein [Chloroflexota bacterium]
MALLLSSGDLARLLDFERVIDAVEGAFAAYSGGRTQTPLRVGVEPPGADGVLLAMPAAVAEPKALGAKIVSVFRGNPARGLPTIHSIYVLSDYDTGAHAAIMDGGYLTAIRTAAGSASATRHLARPDARTLGVFGTGVQARFHVEMIRRVRTLGQVLVSGSSVAKARAFADWVEQATGLAAEPASAEATSAADVVAACTTSRVPVVIADAVRPGAHVNAVGAFTPSTRELPSGLIGRSRVYVDTRAGACAEAGDLLLAVQDGAFALSDLAGEVGEAILGTTAGRTSADAVTVYKSVGAAFLDAATARLAYEEARNIGAGTAYEFTTQR